LKLKGLSENLRLRITSSGEVLVDGQAKYVNIENGTCCFPWNVCAPLQRKA